ncbi:BnaA03g60650D [Brassica napus]|uniref:BnaA03g60650D protein n=2 Tax=Brassica TaxID=3705 RepID=A0A078H4Q7_BRANA|nr:BnaA03g60650D [Brassica napus]VDC76258.1 unnamed protein product [Brassica rapa]
MLRIKRRVSVGYSQAHFILLPNTTQKNELVDVEEAKHYLNKAGNVQGTELPEE